MLALERSDHGFSGESRGGYARRERLPQAGLHGSHRRWTARQSLSGRTQGATARHVTTPTPERYFSSEMQRPGKRRSRQLAFGLPTNILRNERRCWLEEYRIGGMMRSIGGGSILCLFAGLLFSIVGIAQTSPQPRQAPSRGTCLSYEPSVVELTGTIVQKTFADATNRPETRSSRNSRGGPLME